MTAARPVPSLVLLAAVTALAFCALHMVVPALPLLVGVFGDSPARVQLILSLYLAGIAAGQLVYGPLSDRFGRRPVLIAGLLMFLLGTGLCGLATQLNALILGRVLEGFGACAGVVLARAIIRDVYEREAAARGLALVMMAMTLAPAVSPALGALLVEWIDWRAIFVLLGGLGAIVFVTILLRLGETNRAPARLDLVGMAGAYALLLRSPRFVPFALCSACTSASWFTFIASAPHLLADILGEPPRTYGLMILLPMATYMLGNAIAARFALRFGSLNLLVWGRALAFIGAAVLTVWFAALGAGTWALFLPVAFAEIGDGLTQPSVMAAALSIEPRIAGTASGLMGFLQMTTAALGSFLVALLPQNSAFGPVAVFSGLVALSLGFAILAVRRQPGGAPVPVIGGAN
ncbi:MAG TPA: multidrug effflux MFS transporter [Stellaceae bacterium]|jgi:DHA1 family bicyclomycin/chloramphenicol resistance-like MFS transporter|nr:multidrug effflux MFS transporter [Stellaceae bacterium]